MKPEMRHAIMEKAVKALQAGKYSQAISTINKINKLKSQQDYKSLELEAYALFQQQKIDRALTHYQNLLAYAENDQQRNATYKNIGNAQKALGFTQAAIASYQQCFNYDSSIGNANIAASLGECYLDEDRYSELEALAEKMQSWSGYFAPAQALLISAAKKQNQKQIALARIEALLEHSTFVEEWQLEFSIDTLMFIREHHKAAQLLKQAELDFVNKAWISYYQAELAARDNKHQQVIELLCNERLERLDFMRKKAAYKLRAEAYDKQQQFAEAFVDFTAMAKLNHQRAQSLVLKDKVALYQKLDLSFLKPTEANKETGAQPVFMMGFNRSGTTLLENILDTHEKVTTLSETRSLFNVTEAFSLQLKKRYPQDLPSLTEQELSLLRQEYFSYLDSINIELSTSNCLIDKFPLYTIDIPLIVSLFPNAKIIFCLRHPADTCLSNFQQNSANNQEQARLNRLEDCFKRYQQVFTLFKRYQNELNLNMHFVRYEDLVDNLEQEASKVFEFLGLEPSANCLHFDKHAQKKIVLSASSNQVVKPIYTESRYKWLNYHQHLAPHIPLINEFIEQFEYQKVG
ncbi:tetratricopeptide repeat-containing sulfotransferase family protein [Agarivorans sp. MS3-6]|uniref:tetratricopeptide repeat-containing sulfotransferase family protein n=1 Tax=Agarivorans sp. TSD2052 TaxID=2937286 RepID=UPI00200F93E8|nr:sulfotransferase [Agarivorans sp. TSD2052]UPW19747.1 sulfotransferase [Agarivorans sp. TSD2052]